MSEEQYLEDALQLLVRGVAAAKKETGAEKIRLSVDLDGLLLSVAIGDWEPEDEEDE